MASLRGRGFTAFDLGKSFSRPAHAVLSFSLSLYLVCGVGMVYYYYYYVIALRRFVLFLSSRVF